MLADRWGGARVLVGVFIAIAALGALMGCPFMPTFTVGALGAAAALGLGNGAEFKLVPEHFLKETGTVTGLVGAFWWTGRLLSPAGAGSNPRRNGWLCDRVYLARLIGDCLPRGELFCIRSDLTKR
jgi:nitrate/nitrite transporter NarK